MNKSASEMKLPDGRDIFYLNTEEVEYLYAQMPNYLTHGIILEEGNTVFDVGANIGMFSLMCSKLCNNKVNIYAFEPIEPIFQVLKQNIERFNPEGVKLFNCGISNTEKEVVKFQYYPKASGFSTMHFNQSNFRKSISSIMLRNIDELPPSTKKGLTKVPSWLRPLALNLRLRKDLKPTIVNCKLETISKIIRQHNIEQIDLLKIDVEKSEYDVLLGIQEDDWEKIKQIVIEAHDIDNRVERIKTMLTSHGFDRVAVEQETLLEESEYFNIYASRNR